MCGPHFCSMKITEDVRRSAAQKGIDGGTAIEQGLREKAEESQQAGAEIYPSCERSGCGRLMIRFLYTRLTLFTGKDSRW